jgi:inner membrane protein
MDTVTQALLGAAVGQAGFSHRLGRRALVWGALGGVLPDLDVLAIAVDGPFAEFRYHRGITHSLFFGPVVGPLLGWLLWRFQRWRGRSHPGGLSVWMALFTMALVTHPLIDIFTVYGTQLFAPFSLERIAWNALGIIDPIYSGILVAGLAAGFLARHHLARARSAGFAALAPSWSYMFYGLWLNDRAAADVRAALPVAGGGHAVVRVYPTILQPYLRRVVVRSDGEVRVGLYTPFRPGEPVLESFRESRHPMIDALKRTPEGSLFTWFAMQEVVGRVMTTVDGYVVELDDLRYGMPGRPAEGFWGVRGVFDARGRLIEPVRRFRRSRGDGEVGFGDLWAAMWGDFAALGLGAPAR